jgi:hypothetical protein
LPLPSMTRAEGKDMTVCENEFNLLLSTT